MDKKIYLNFINNCWKLGNHILCLIKRLASSKFKWIVIAVILLSIAIKTVFIFHGYWDSQFFVPYNTDETTVLNFMDGYFHQVKYDASGLASIGYFTFLHNLFFVFLYTVVNLFKITKLNLGQLASNYVLMAYSGRFLIVLFSTGLSWYCWKTFCSTFKYKTIVIFYLILLNFNIEYFFWSQYIKYDMIVAAMGFASIYYGLKYFNSRSNRDYFKFYLLAVLAVSAGQYGYVYLLNLILVTLYVQRWSFFKKKFNIFLIFLAPVVFGILNWQIVIYWREFLNSQHYLDGSAKIIIPFLTDTNGLSSFSWYMLFLKDFLGWATVILAVAGFYIFIKNKKDFVYYKLLLISFLLYFIQLSFNSYRVDRMMIPFIGIILFFAFYAFDRILSVSKKYALKFIISLALTAMLFVLPLYKTATYGKSLLQPDTRYLLYQWLEENLPEKETINFFHFSIAGAFSTAQKISNGNPKEFSIKGVDLNNIENLEDNFYNLKGYMVISLVDKQILENYNNFDNYKKQNQLLEKMTEENKLVKIVDNGGSSNIKSLAIYGLRNPPLAVYKITKDDIKSVMPYFQINPNKNVIDRWTFEESNRFGTVSGWELSSKKKSNYAIAKIVPIKFENGNIKNGAEISTSGEEVNFSLSYKGEKDIYGFAGASYEGKPFMASAWVQSSRPNCVRIGIYRGNNSATALSEYNNWSESDGGYELLQLRDKFDQPYTLNGGISFLLQPHCTVKIANPAVFIGQISREEIEKNQAHQYK